MPAITTGLAKNIVRRAFHQVVDPGPNAREKDLLWEYFEARCAYCDRPLNRDAKEAHLDHLVSAAQGGRNHLSNRALSCARCNEQEKRDTPWTEFLRAKSPSPNEFVRRFDRIQQWQARHTDAVSQEMRNLRLAADVAAREVVELFDRKVEELRALRPTRRATPGRPSAASASRGAPENLATSRYTGGRNAATLPHPAVRYASSRLTFKADLIEPLAPPEHFRVDTPVGSFQMSKAEFYDAFPKLVQTPSYQVQRVYHSKAPPRHALPFLCRNEDERSPGP
jgi:hypothetical protein